MNLGEIALIHGASAAKIMADLAKDDPEGAEMIARAVMHPEFIEEKIKVLTSERLTSERRFKARQCWGV